MLLVKGRDHGVDRLPVDLAAGEWDGQVRHLTLILHVELGDYLLAAVIEAFRPQLAPSLLPQFVKQLGQLCYVKFGEGLEVGLDEMVFNVGHQ